MPLSILFLLPLQRINQVKGFLQHASLKIACSLTPPLLERALGYRLLAEQKATLGEGCYNGKTDRHTYSVCASLILAAPGPTGASVRCVDAVVKVTEVNIRASENNKYAERERGAE